MLQNRLLIIKLINIFYSFYEEYSNIFSYAYENTTRFDFSIDLDISIDQPKKLHNLIIKKLKKAST